MSEFEGWFTDQSFYTNMRFIHGDALFLRDGDVYRVLPVQMTYVGWGEKKTENIELREVGVALNTETINQRRYMVTQANKNERLSEMNQRYIGKMQEQQDQIAELYKLIGSLRSEFDLWCDCPPVERQIELLEEIVRGANDQHLTR